ncbi:MAG: PASTA domain-containing protein [Myxococcales bacterium]|nr:PASTA domain-containing protein [Myxococcales bacterium]
MRMGWAGDQRWVRVRLYAAGILFTGLFALLAQRAFVLQVYEAKKLLEMAEDQYVKDIELPSRRGRILDRNGTELAASAEVDSIYVNPRQIAAAGATDETSRALARLLHMDRRDLAIPLSSRRYFAWIKRRTLPEEAKAVKEAGLRGVFLAKEPRRYYPNRSLGGPLVGWAGLDGKGLEGIELRYDKDLRGSPAEVPGLRDALGREVLSSGIADAPPQGGHDVVLTVDKFIQYRLEKALEEGVQKNRAKAGVAVALDPRSGEVLGMASVPTVNPNDPTGARDHGARNRVVTDPYEPGSTMKVFSIAAAVEAGLVKPDDKWWCENGKYAIGSAVIHDAEKIGVATTTQVLAESSNICTAKIARRAGRDRLDSMLRRLGFGAQLGIDLPAERAGLLRPVKRWGEIELATISFGQGMTATPLQVASGYATIANGGTLYRPHVVRKVVDERGRTVAELAPVGQRILDKATANIMRQMLFAVTQKGGTGEKLAIPGYPSGGKTGTAQKVDPLTRHYSTDKWASSFVGFAPLDDPRLVILVMIDEPVGSHYGSAVAGPVWREVMIDALRYLGVTPTVDGLPPPAPAAPPALAAIAAAPPALVALADPDDDEGDSDDGSAADGYLASRDESGDAQEIPDFTGMSLGETLAAARRAHLPVEVTGSGKVIGQSPGPGRAAEGARCRVSLAPPG